MRIGAGAVAVIVFTLVVLIAITTAGLIRGFMRETTGIDERWGGSAAARQALTEQIAGLDGSNDIPSNYNSVTPRPLPKNEDYDGDGLLNGAETGNGNFHGLPTNGIDSDGDGIPNDIEEALGTDPNDPDSFPDIGTDARNPDTDGDGVSDRDEVLHGTDPNNPDKGGTAPPPTVPGPTQPQRGELVINKVVKAVKEQGSSIWTHFVEVTIGNSVDMWIHIEVENKDSRTHTIIVEDKLSAGLTYTGNGTYKGVIDDFTRPLPSDWFEKTHSIELLAGAARIVDIRFSVSVTTTDLNYNFVNVYDQNSVGNSLDDKVFVLGRSTSGGQLPSGAVIFNKFDKQVKEDDQSTFSDSVTASLGEIVDFRILLEVTNTYTTARTLLLTDVPPKELKYLSGQGDLGDLFQEGYFRISVQPGEQKFTFNFSATVVSGANQTVYNIAKVYEAKFAPNGAIDNAEVIIK